MDKDWTKKFELSGKERGDVLARCYNILENWEMKMPNVKVLVLDFGLDDFYKTGLVEFWIANEEKEGYCGKFLFLFAGQTCPYHHHKFKHETFFVVRGSILMSVEDKKFIMSAGDVKIMSQETGHSFAGRGDALVLEASKPCVLGDSIFKNKKIGKDGKI